MEQIKNTSKPVEILPGDEIAQRFSIFPAFAPSSFPDFQCDQASKRERDSSDVSLESGTQAAAHSSFRLQKWMLSKFNIASAPCICSEVWVSWGCGAATSRDRTAAPALPSLGLPGSLKQKFP